MSQNLFLVLVQDAIFSPVSRNDVTRSPGGHAMREIKKAAFHKKRELKRRSENKRLDLTQQGWHNQILSLTRSTQKVDFLIRCVL